MINLWPTPTAVSSEDDLDFLAPKNTGHFTPENAFTDGVHVNATLGKGDMEFHRDVERSSNPTPALPDIILTCMQAIVSRAIMAQLVPEDYRDTALESRLTSLDPEHTPVSFWQGVYESYLNDGAVLFYRNGESLCFSSEFFLEQHPDPTQAHWRATERSARRQDTQELEIPYMEAAVAIWHSTGARVLEPGDSPVRLSLNAAEAYQEALQLLYSYCVRGHKIGAVIQQNKAFESPDNVRRFVETTREILNHEGNYQVLHAMNGFQFEQSPQTSQAPHLVAVFEQSAAAVARNFGVPIQLIGLAPGGQRVMASELETHLLKDAIHPMLRKIGDAVSQVAGGRVKWDMGQVGRPGFDGMAGYLMTFAQTGIMTINEIRDYLNLPPLSEGERLPEVAGAGTRREDGEPRQEKVIGKKKKHSAAPKELDEVKGEGGAKKAGAKKKPAAD